MSNFPPEKYYEACITYNIVKEFDEREKRIYPFSISQIEERSKGYDFGYTYSNKSFFIQYKRPLLYDSENSIYTWQICREQLGIINSKNYGIRTYYALPAFIDTRQWFEGLENTYFVAAPNLQNHLKSKNDTKTNNINSKNGILKKWDYFSQFHKSLQKNVAYSVDESGITFEDILFYAQNLNEETRKNTWVYLMEDDNNYVF